MTWRSCIAVVEKPTAKNMKQKKGKPLFTSLRQFSWSGEKGRTGTEAMIEATVLEWYEQKHRKPSPEELALINSIKPKCCPHCGGTFAKDGFRESGIRSFECCECGKKFTALTGTIFDSKKIPISEWIEFLLHLFEFHSLKTSASDNRNAETTGRYWLSKVFAVLRGIQDGVVLSGRVWIDEKLFDAPKSEKESAKRKSNAKGGLTRGCQYYVACGTDGERSFYVVTGKSKPGDKTMLKAYGKRIAECSTLVHDGNKGYNAVIDALALKSEVHTSAETRGMKDEDNPLDEINDLHDKMEKFMRAHSGYDRASLQDWMNLFWLLTNGPRDKMDKVKWFLEMAFSKKIRIKYRDRFGKIEK